jgi:hypothetical protein
MDDSRSFLVLVAIGVASTSVKAATCKRGKKLAYNDAFCSGGEKLHSSGAKRIEAIKRSMREDFAVPEELKRKPYPAQTSPLGRTERQGGWECLLNPTVAATSKM